MARVHRQLVARGDSPAPRHQLVLHHRRPLLRPRTGRALPRVEAASPRREARPRRGGGAGGGERDNRRPRQRHTLHQELRLALHRQLRDRQLSLPGTLYIIKDD